MWKCDECDERENARPNVSWADDDYDECGNVKMLELKMEKQFPGALAMFVELI